MKTSDLVRQFGVSETTIRRWTATFEHYLSDLATKKDGHARQFTSNDFLVLATIHCLTKEGHSFAEVHGKLKSGYRIEDTGAATAGYEDGRLVPAAVVDQIIDAAQIRVELEQVKGHRDRLLELLQKAQEKEELTQKEVKELRDRIEQLQRDLGRAEGRLEELTKRAPRDN